MARLVTSGEARSAARCFPCAEGVRCVTGGPEPSSALLRVAVSFAYGCWWRDAGQV